jgi:PAS domain S-box-containing protein
MAPIGKGASAVMRLLRDWLSPGRKDQQEPGTTPKQALVPDVPQLVAPVAAAAIAIAIFLVDTISTLDIAIAVLYVVVVLLAAGFLNRRGVLALSTACLVLTVLAYLWSHGVTAGTAALRCVVSLAAIAITTVLALKTQAATTVLREQAGLLDLTHDTIFVRDMEDCITYWNRGAEQLYGWRRDEAIGRPSHVLLRTVFPAPLADIRAELLRSGRWEGELVHTKRNGTQVTVSSRWSLQLGEQGKPLAVLETNTDISERKEAEARARDHQRELQLMIDSIPTLAWHTRPDGFAEYLNRPWLNYTGLSLEQASGWNWKVAIHPDDLPGLLAEWDAILKGGMPAEVEARLRRFDGQYRWFLFRPSPLRDESGKIIRWYGTNTDIEDRKRAEDALRRSEAYLAEGQKLSLTGSFGWKVKSGEMFWSAQTYSIFGFDAAVTPTIDLVKQRIHPDDVAIVEQTFQRASQDGSTIEFEHRLLMPDGSIKYLRVLARTVCHELVGAVMDVTAVRRAQEALQQAQAELAHVTRVMTLGELTASIAHEVNQPLAGIVTNGEASLRWLEREVPDIDEARSALQRMVSDANRASNVIRRIRQLAKKAVPEMTQLDINDVITDTVPLVQRQAFIHRVKVRLELAPALPSVSGDRIQLQQVLINLIINAIDSMALVSEHDRELIVRSQVHENNDVLVAVRDVGMGIAPENVGQLFKAFYTTKPQGMGMGLSICRSIVEAHGGRVWASAGNERGATIQFTLPGHLAS